MALVTKGTYGSNPALQYELYCDQIYGSGTERGVTLTAYLKVAGSTSTSRYGYPLNIEFYINGKYSGQMWCKGSETWYATDNWRTYSANIYFDVGTTSSKAVTAGFNTSRSDGGSSSWNSGAAGSFTVGSTNTPPYWSNGKFELRNGSATGTLLSGIIPENITDIFAMWSGGSDNEGGVLRYGLNCTTGNGYNTIYYDTGTSYKHSIGTGNEGVTYDYYVDIRDDHDALSNDKLYAKVTKNTFTPHTISSAANIEFNTDNVVFTFSGAKNTYTGTNSDVFTMLLSSSDITVYNQSVKTSPVTLSIYKSGTLPTGPYIKFSDLVSKFKSSSYKGSLTFVLTTSNAFGTSKTSSKTLSVNLQIAPNPVTSQQISLTQSESTAYLTIGTTSNKYFIPDGSKVVRVKWNAGSGKLGEDIKYELYVAYGNGSWQKVADLTQGTNYYNHVIPKQTISQQFKYMVRTICSYNTSLYTDVVTTAQTLHFYNTPTLTLGTITRTSTTADVQVTVKSNSSIPNINTVGTWKCCNKGTTTAVSNGNLGQAQTVQVIKAVSLTDAGTYDLIVTYKDDTGFSSNISISISIGQNQSIFYVNKYGIGIGGAKAEQGKELNVKGKIFTNDNEVYHLGNKPTWDNVTNKPSTFTPSSHKHPAIDVTTDATHRFVTDIQIGNWDNAYIVEESAYSNINSKAWVKYSNGIMIAYGNVWLYAPIYANNAWNGLYYFSWDNPVSYGCKFVDYPVPFVNFESTDSIGAIATGGSLTGISNVRIFTPWQNGNVPGILHYIAIGRWK
ncbi:MAG: hypothetical protein MR639_08905 [Clostridium sp.]|uniref:hypothetical protein n=1 Tax=Clostridium sp. TaxID=1506 RepID=UPI002A8BEA53|nr:hypothetical protein [Clostridium sp.]MDY5096689.1 hypothetical protein [Clostridium sp.]